MMMRDFCTCDVSTRNKKISLFFLLPRLSLSLTKFFFSSCCGGKERQTSIVEKEDFWTKIKKEPLSFVSEKGILSFEIFAFFLSVVVYKRLKRTTRIE